MLLCQQSRESFYLGEQKSSFPITALSAPKIYKCLYDILSNLFFDKSLNNNMLVCIVHSIVLPD
jgi:hypothetical protein